MNIRHLKILEAIAQAGTFTGAAKKLHLTQSAVSHAMSELEQKTGTVLFDRLPRGVRLTQCGLLLLEEAVRILTAFRSLEQRINHLEDHAPIRIASSITIASFHLPKILMRLQSQIPKLNIHVQVVSAACAMDILHEGDADIALIEGTEPQGLFHSKVLGSYHLLAACAPGYPLSENAITLKKFCSLPLLLREKGSAIRDTLDSALYLMNQTAYPLWESVNSNALIKAAEAGLGATVLPDLLLTDLIEQGRLRLLEINDIIMENKMLAVYHKDKSLTNNLQMLLDALSIN